MSERLANTINVIVPTGSIGTGVRESDLRTGIARGAHAIACDAGSTDSGPAYLATGRAKYSRDSVKADLSTLMRAQAEAQIPLLIGSCGTSGCDMALDWTRDIVLEIAREIGVTPRIALLYSEQPAAMLEDRSSKGQITPLPPMSSVEPGLFCQCEHIVALMGYEPYVAALQAGADIVLGGRTTDTAVLAAVPLMYGKGAGAAWHAAKTAECGGLCTVNPTESGVMIRVGDEAFEIEPLSPTNRCTPETVSAHMLYENSDPFVLPEPGGTLNVTRAHYRSVNESAVEVTGSIFEPAPYTMKLEGASISGYQTIILVGIQDRRVLRELSRFISQLQTVLKDRVQATLAISSDTYHISLRAYGWNAVSGLDPKQSEPPPREVGLLFVATAATQELATRIAKTCNPYLFHMPLDLGIELPSYAYPFSPAEIERGPVCEFKLNHVVHVSAPNELVRMKFINVGERSYA